MSDVGKRDVERLLRAHYRAERGAPDEMSKAAALAAVRAAVASEQRSSASAEAAAGATVGERSREATFAGFVAAQARFIHPRVWVAQLALMAVMAVLCLPSSGMAHGIPVVSGMLAAATVLVGLPELLASAAHRVAELEYACRFDCRAVALARLIVLGVFGRGDGHRHRARGACHARRRSLRVARARVRSLLPLVRGRAARGAPVPFVAGAGAVVRVGAAGDRGHVCGVLPRPRCVRPGVDMGMGACGGGLARLGRARGAHVDSRHRGRP